MKLVSPLKRDLIITQHYGENPEIYKQYKIGGVALKGHEGLDLRAASGTEVVACDDGFCQEALDQGSVGYGRYIKLIHAWGESVYAHLSDFKIKQGEEVRAGTVIGLSGSTGNSTGPHLHLGLRINPYNRADGWGGYTDPKPYLFNEPTTSIELPVWAKNLQPFFVENNLKDDQVESFVRGAFDNTKILIGFIAKWGQKFSLPDGFDLSAIEKEIQTLLEIEDNHTELVSAVKQVVGNLQTEKALRDGVRAIKTDLDQLAKTVTVLTEENALLRKKRTLDKYTVQALLAEIVRKVLRELKGGGIK